nr:reactive oxygen species modulator 1-like [Desmodus rotundus]
MPVAIGPYGQSQLSCFNRTKVDFVMGCTMGMVAGTFSCLGIGVHGQELIGSTRKTMIQSGSTFGTFMPIKVALLLQCATGQLPTSRVRISSLEGFLSSCLWA